jgi:hypothetical protein
LTSSIVVFVVVLFGEIERDVGNFVMHDRLRGDLGVRSDLSAPAEPNARFLLERALTATSSPPARAFAFLFGNGDSVGDYDKLRQ